MSPAVSALGGVHLQRQRGQGVRHQIRHQRGGDPGVRECDHHGGFLHVDHSGDRCPSANRFVFFFGGGLLVFDPRALARLGRETTVHGTAAIVNRTFMAPAHTPSRPLP